MRPLRASLAVAVLAALAWLAWRSIEWEGFAQAFADANPVMLLWMMLAWSMQLLIRPYRFLIMLRAMVPSMKFDYAGVARANVLAVAANNLLPARAGDLVMVMVLRKMSSIKARHSLPATALDKGVDLLIMLALFLGILANLDTAPAWVPRSAQVGLGAFLVILVGVCVVAYRPDALLRMAAHLLRWFSKDRRTRWLGVLQDMSDGTAAAMKPAVVVEVMALTLLLWVFNVASFLCGIRAVIPEVSLAGAAFTLAAVGLSFLIPVVPGGLGIYHATAVVALALFGIPLEKAMVFAILAHGLPYLTSLAVGYAVSMKTGLGMDLIAKSHESSER